MVEGHPCRLIALTKGLFATVWEEDYARIAVHNWCVTWCDKTQSYYATRNGIVDGKRGSIKMHREILGLERGDKRQGDHIRSGETLDNRRDNLRISTNTQNQQNRRTQVRNTTGFKGVSKFRNGFSAHIRVQGVLKYLGTRKTAKEAHELYNAAALRYFGEHANDGENGLYGKSELGVA